MDREDPTPEEIAKNKDFSKVLNKFSAMSNPIYTKTWFLSTAVLVVAAGLLIIVNMVNFKTEAVKDAQKNQSYVYQPANIDLINETPYVDPPLDGVDIAYESYTVDAGEKSKLEYSTGTKIKVPKNAFMDADGETVEGEVEIKYREFHDVADFFVSGIPMDYDSAGVKYHFESAGMLEILAFQNGEPVYMKDGKEVKIEMASNYESTHYNLYELDTKNRRWEHRGKDRVTPTAGYDQIPEPPAPTQVVEVVADDSEVSDIEMLIVPEEVLPVKKLSQKLRMAKVAVERVKKTEPIEPVEVSRDKYNFDIAVDPKEFPEIAIYEGTRFEIGDENTSFNAKMYEIDWEDVLLEEKVAGVNYNITLTKGETKYTWVVYPVYEGEDYKKATEVFKQKFDTYKEKLSTRVLEEKKAKELYEAKLAEYEEMRKEQMKLWKEQNRQYEQSVQLRNERMRTRQYAIRAFNINRFGTWNCDSPIPRPKGTTVAARFTDEQGNILHFNNVHLVQKDRNALFSYSPGMYRKLKFNPREANVLWGVTSDNRLAIFEQNRFSEVPKSGDFTFKMRVLDNKLVSTAEVREALSLKAI